MRVPVREIPVKVQADGATARQQTGFGDASDYGTIGAEHFALAEGTDITPLLQGLDGDLCHAPHWGYMIDGELTVTYGDGSSENVSAGDAFHWPPGHTVRADRDVEFVLFSPQHEHTAVLDHINDKLQG